MIISRGNTPLIFSALWNSGTAAMLLFPPFFFFQKDLTKTSLILERVRGTSRSNIFRLVRKSTAAVASHGTPQLFADNKALFIYVADSPVCFFSTRRMLRSVNNKRVNTINPHFGSLVSPTFATPAAFAASAALRNASYPTWRPARNTRAVRRHCTRARGFACVCNERSEIQRDNFIIIYGNVRLFFGHSYEKNALLTSYHVAFQLKST